MALSATANLKARLVIAASGDTTFENKTFELNASLDHISEEAYSDRQFIDGVETDKAVSLGGVSTPTFIYVRFISKFNGDSATVEDAVTKVSIKVNSGTAFDCNSILLLVDDPINDEVTSTITYTTSADTDTIVETYVVGRSS